MRCYHVIDERTGKKVLIPGCWDVVHSNDFSDCTCYPKKPPTAESLELAELRAENKHLHEELKKHVELIEKLTNERKI